MFVSGLVKTELLWKGGNNHAGLCLRSVLLPLLGTFFPTCIRYFMEDTAVIEETAVKWLFRQNLSLTLYTAPYQRCLGVYISG